MLGDIIPAISLLVTLWLSTYWFSDYTLTSITGKLVTSLLVTNVFTWTEDASVVKICQIGEHIFTTDPSLLDKGKKNRDTA